MTRDPARQIEEIHRRLSVTTGFHGFRPVFLYGVAGFGAFATVANYLALSETPTGLRCTAIAWLVVAGLVVGLTGAFVIVPALRADSRFPREAARGVSLQLAPVLLSGLAVSLVVMSERPELLPFLPAGWALIMGLGIVSMAPYLPQRARFAALWYFACAVVACRLVPNGTEAFNVMVGTTFSVGHLLTGLLLGAGGGNRDGR